MAAELLQLEAKIKLVHVAYKGGGPAMTDLLGGHIPLLFASLGTTVPHIRSGKIAGLAVTSTARVPAIPNMPTVAELGYPASKRWSGSASSARRSCRANT